MKYFNIICISSLVLFALLTSYNELIKDGSVTSSNLNIDDGRLKDIEVNQEVSEQRDSNVIDRDSNTGAHSKRESATYSLARTSIDGIYPFSLHLGLEIITTKSGAIRIASACLKNTENCFLFVPDLYNLNYMDKVPIQGSRFI